MTATIKQLEYRQALIDKKVGSLIGGFDNRRLLEAIAAVNLPEPASKTDASAQIDALKGQLQHYAQANPEWFAELQYKAQAKLENIRTEVKSDRVKHSLYPVEVLRDILVL